MFKNRLMVGGISLFSSLLVGSLFLSTPTLAVFPNPQLETTSVVAAMPSAPYSNIDATLLRAFSSKPQSVVITASNRAALSARLGSGVALRSLGGSQFSASISATQLASLKAMPGVRVDAVHAISVSPSEFKPSSVSPAFSAQPIEDPEIINTVPGTDSGLLAAESTMHATGTGSVVAVIDTGIDTNAAGLSGQVIARQDFSSVSGKCTDNGFLDPVGHGTHIASIIAGKPVATTTDPTVAGMQGIAPGAKLVDLRVFNCAGAGTDTQVIQALNWVLANKAALGINVVNLSMGITGGVLDGTDALSVLVNQVTAQGVFVAVASGNTGDAPGSINSPGTARFAVTVGASTTSKYGSFLAPYSSVGPTSDGRDGIDFIAPGSGIRAALTTAHAVGGAQTVVYAGTSMAAPYVAGLAAVLHGLYGESPHGSTCTVGVGCPDGVVDTSMTNPLEDRIKATDMLASGSDPNTGAGLVSASSTILGTAAPAASSITGSLTSTGTNTLVVPAHSAPASISFELPVAVRSSLAENGALHIALSDSRYITTPLQTPCSWTGSKSCVWTAGTYNPHSYALFLPASRTSQYLTLTTPKNLTFSASVYPAVGQLYMLGESVTATDALSGTSTVTVTRTRFSALATTFTVTSSGTMAPMADQILPAGGVGTSVTFPVAITPGKFAGERIILSGTDSAILSVGVQTKSSGTGRLSFPNQFGFDDMYAGGNNVTVTDGGSIYLQSRATGIANGQGFDQLASAPADSLSVSKLNIPQTNSTEIDLVSVADDGSSLVGMEYPSGTGLVAADATPNGMYHFFARNLTSGATVQVGPTDNSFATYTDEQASGTKVALNNDGSAVAWGARLGGATGATTIALQTGAGYSTTVALDSVASSYQFGSIQFHGNTVVAEFTSATGAAIYRVYNIGANPVAAHSFVPSATTSGVYSLSQNGQALAAFDSSTDDVYCELSGAITKYTKLVGLPSLSGQNVLSVANDCSSVTVEMLNKSTTGIQTNYLIQIHPDGSYQVINAALYTHWYSNAAGTSIVTASLLQLEPSDVNGEADLLRGVFAPLSSLQTGLSVAIAGTASYGQTLTASVANVSRSASISYYWFRNDVPITGTIGNSYKVASADANTTLKVQAVISLGGYYRALLMSSPMVEHTTNQVLNATPSVSGTPNVGLQISALPGTWDAGVSFSYQWLRGGTAIAGANASTYSLTSADLAGKVSVAVTGSKPGYFPLTKTSPTVTVGVGTLVLKPVPVITGSLAVGKVLTMVAGTWDDGTILTYQWLRDGKVLAGQTAQTYEIVPIDVGTNIQARVTATKIGYQSASSTSASGLVQLGNLVFTPAPVVSGTPRFGQTLTAAAGTWDVGVKITYQWLRDGQSIAGANFSRYTLTGDDVGKQISVSNSGTLNSFRPVTTFSTSLTGLPGVQVNIPDPSISGTLTVGSNLEVFTGEWDAGVVLAYQWLRDGQPISGATAATYVLTTADLNHAITVQVTGTLANYETLVRVTAPVTPIAGVLHLSLKVKGKAKVGKVIAVAVSGAPAGAVVKYQWLLGGKPIKKAVKSKYTPTAKQKNKKLLVRVTVLVNGAQSAVLFSKAQKVK